MKIHGRVRERNPEKGTKAKMLEEQTMMISLRVLACSVTFLYITDPNGQE